MRSTRPSDDARGCAAAAKNVGAEVTLANRRRTAARRRLRPGVPSPPAFVDQSVERVVVVVIDGGAVPLTPRCRSAVSRRRRRRRRRSHLGGERRREALRREVAPDDGAPPEWIAQRTRLNRPSDHRREAKTIESATKIVDASAASRATSPRSSWKPGRRVAPFAARNVSTRHDLPVASARASTPRVDAVRRVICGPNAKRATATRCWRRVALRQRGPVTHGEGA